MAQGGAGGPSLVFVGGDTAADDGRGLEAPTLGQLIGAGAVQDVAAGAGALATWKHRDLWPPRDIFQGDREGVRAVDIAPGISTEPGHISIVQSKSFGPASEDDSGSPGEVPADPNDLDC